jgi:hypothetical protein
MGYTIISPKTISYNFTEEPTITLTKIQIVESTQNQTGFPRNRSLEIVETLLEIIKSTLVSGEDVLISGFAYKKGRASALLFFIGMIYLA